MRTFDGDTVSFIKLINFEDVLRKSVLHLVIDLIRVYCYVQDGRGLRLDIKIVYAGDTFHLWNHEIYQFCLYVKH